METHVGHGGGWVDFLLVLPFVVATVLYGLAVLVSRRRGRPWPATRSLCWLLGTVVCLAAVTGPLAERAEQSFPTHMVSHLLLGMLGPVLLARSAPVTLVLRSLDVHSARRVVRVLNGRPVRFFSHPVPAGVGGVGGLGLLYLTPLYGRMQTDALVHLLVMVHVFVFGYLFAAAMVGVDPDRHRPGFGHRSVVLVLYVAAHSVLAKQIYAVPPVGVQVPAAELGAQVMYYGGDVVHLAMMTLLWHRWYVSPAADTRPVPAAGPDPSPAAG